MSDDGAAFRKTSSKKRGRPRLLSPKEVEIVDSYASQSTTRGKQNHYYYMLALATLPDSDPRFAWLWSGGEARATILSELGRFRDQDVILKLALEICESKMTTRKAVRLLRECRGVKLPAIRHKAANAIITTVNNYFKSHPDTTIEKMIDALRVVLWALEDRRAAIAQGDCGVKREAR
ncbi:MAG TPA: hypothetical protein VFV58_24125 [Blastocatellia bacterium]|jgi:hypothetical protein|nr:hypothetical protein [Blastocatellia bacterium]